MERAVEFNLCGLTLRGNEVQTFQKPERFREPWVIKRIGRRHYCHNLNGRPVHQFCQQCDHRLSFFLATRQVPLPAGFVKIQIVTRIRAPKLCRVAKRKKGDCTPPAHLAGTTNPKDTLKHELQQQRP